MTASFSTIVSEFFFGSISTIISVLKVLIPLMIIIEILQVYNVMQKLSKKLASITKLLGMSPPAILPLLVAIVMGVTYGAGTLMEMNKVNPIPKKDYVLIAVFFFICHGIIETSAIWAAAGANLIIISVGRLVYAFIVTMIVGRLPIFYNHKSFKDLND
ncbi:MAG: hypothetical protein GX076_06575 [Clostridiales bacterium]|nr:hypothetical protein [Clostridiales bacterium]